MPILSKIIWNIKWCWDCFPVSPLSLILLDIQTFPYVIFQCIRRLKLFFWCLLKAFNPHSTLFSSSDHPVGWSGEAAKSTLSHFLTLANHFGRTLLERFTCLFLEFPVMWALHFLLHSWYMFVTTQVWHH